MTKKHSVEIPEVYLLQIAVAGDMGSGELLDLMKNWAQQECKRLELSQKLRDLQLEHLAELRDRLRNTIGDDLMGKVDQSISEAVDILRQVR